MTHSFFVMMLGPMIIPLSFALPPLICAALLHLEEGRGGRPRA